MTQNLSCQGLQVIKDVRDSLDQAGCQDRTVLIATDGSYCNRNIFRGLPDRVEVIERARGDITLYRQPTAEQLTGRGRRRKYGDELPKPKEIRTSDAYPWQAARIFGAGRLHDLRYKMVANVLWKSGTLARPMRLIIIAPLQYRRTKKSKLLYRDPAYLLTTDLTSSVETLIQAYFDRWEIEVNHRDEKSMFGVGEAQVWSALAAPRVPQFQVAVYAMLLLASLIAYGPKRTDHYPLLPKWRKEQERRPSVLDMLALIREELMAEGVTAVHSTKQTPSGWSASRLKRMPVAG